MQKKFITNLAFLLFINLLIKPFWILGIDRAVQNSVGSAEYGFYYSLFNFTFLFNILLDFGITNFNNKNISQNNHLLSKHLSSIIILRIALAVVYLIVSVIVGLCIGYDIRQLGFLLIMSFNQVLISFILYLRSNLAGLHLFKTDSIISVLDRLIMIAICSFLLWGGITNKPFKIEWYIIGQTMAYIITALVTLVIVIDKAQLRKLNHNMAFYIMILKKSYPYAVLVLLMSFYNRIDTVMLERMLPVDGKHQAGIYASAYRLLDAANMMAFLFAGILLPIFAKMLKQKQAIDELVKLAFSLLVIPAMVVAIGSFFFSTEFMTLLYHDNVAESSRIFSILMICFVPISTTYIFGTLLTANGSMKHLNIMAFGGMLINLTLNVILIPHFKVMGTAVASLSTQLFTALAQVLIAQYLFKLRINYALLLKTALFVIVCIFIYKYNTILPFAWTLRFIITTAAAFTIAFLLRIISIKGMVLILKEEK